MLILRSLQNLHCGFLKIWPFFCPNKQKGCTEQIKYHFYFDHFHNTCTYKIEGIEFCKICKTINSTQNEKHKCEDKQTTEALSEIEKKINDLYLDTNDPNTPSNQKTTLPQGTINIPKLHNHNLVLTNTRLNIDYDQGWCCELCSDHIRNPQTKSYHCKLCDFDVCEKCYLHISTRLPNQTCHNHEVNLEMRDLEWVCYICEQVYYYRRSWYCAICEFDCCIFCYWK